MINRILIRVKVVQMLYSYLLTQSEFHIDAAPEAPSADRRGVSRYAVGRNGAVRHNYSERARRSGSGS